MLSRVPLETLQKIALYGGVFTTAACCLMYYLGERQRRSRPYFTKPVRIMKKDKRITKFLGEPIRIRMYEYGNEENKISTEFAQISIPVIGTRNSGILKSRATFRNGEWKLDSVSFHHKDKFVELPIDDCPTS